MESRGEEMPLPPVIHQHLIRWWLEIGPAEAAGMGEAPVSWREIEAWEGRIGIELLPWEARAIRAMSGAYVSQKHEARKPSCAAPYCERKDEAAASAVVDRQFAAMFKALAKR